LEIIIHRINTIKELKKVSSIYGAEIDIRASGSNLILNHDPFEKGEKLINYLDEYQNGTLILNIKEAGIEETVLGYIKERPYIKSYFLLDVEFPYLYRTSHLGNKHIAIRFSKDESIETVKNYVGKVNWVWIDTMETLPLNSKNIEIIKNFKKCMVCPSRWGQEHKIKDYLDILKRLNMNIDSVMTSMDYISKYSDT